MALPALLGLAAWAPAAGGVELVRGPYLQQLTESYALVVWRTSVAAACTLDYGPTFAGQVVTPAGTEHVAPIGFLAPDTRYPYRIRCGAQLAGGSDFYFDTAPAPGQGAPVRFLVWGDSGKGNAEQAAVAARLNLEDADLALVVGDIVYPYGEAALYDERYFQPYAPLLRRVCAWGALGNHDAYNTQDYLDAWYLPINPVNGSELYYSFDYGDVHFVCLDSNAAFDQPLLDWLTADLAATSRRWKVVFFHHPPYTCGLHGSDGYLINKIVPVFEATGVDLVLAGHDHHYERSHPILDGQAVDAAMGPDYTNPRGPIYVVTGGGANVRSVSTSCWFTARALSVSHFTRVRVEADSLILEPVGTAGQVLDRMTIVKTDDPVPPPPPPPPSLSVTAPAGGEQAMVGAMLELRWATGGGVGPVRIELSREGPSGPWTEIFASTPNDGVETWMVSGPPSELCWLRVSEAADGLPAGISSGAFHIFEPAGPGTWARIDFHPPGSATAPGWQADTGALFDASLGRGWAAPVTMRVRGMLPGDTRDTFAEVRNNAPLAIWEMEMPNGGYLVSLTCGDPLTSATHRVAIEDHVVVADVYTSGGHWVQRTGVPVNVQDGRLTVTMGGIGNLTRTKLASIEIYSTDVASDAVIAPSAIVELGARPNPFNPTTTIYYALAESAPVRLTVHDIAGRLVATLVETVRPAGRYAHEWHAVGRAGRPLASGVYFVCLEAGEDRRSTKLVLVR
jgi:hypothetical protein